MRYAISHRAKGGLSWTDFSVKEEQIQAKAGNFDAYKIIPRVINLTRLGHEKRMRHATVWVSADINRRVLKVASQVFIGSVYPDPKKVEG